ncbi:MAG: DegT/DnrJ/EryC1/StrS family aminotransferase [Chloroflexus sp.]|uniref:DegT/DnrJ/EryC1/StrS family aminotransferase n=1 Tax=Chloroflexus sp. TaxID=1904827 RepID=UPI00404AF58A
MRIPITKPFFGVEELRAVQLPLESGWVVQGPFVREFEEKFSAFTGARFSVATSSCTTALHIAVAALGLKPGDEVIVPAFTWVSTANVVEYMGAKPVFCDIDLRTFNIDTSQIEALITPRTVGMIPVHLFGLCADMHPILEIARKHNLWVVEDAACAFGARYCGRHAGTFGEMGCFSFHPRKSITTGEGGMITTQREDFDQLARSLRDHGASRSDLARHEGKAGFLLAEYNHLGYNYRMTDIQGALGCAQMERAEWILAERARRARLYDEMLAEVEWLQTPVVPDGYVHGYQSYVCLFCPEKPTLDNVERLHQRRNQLMRRLEEKGIATRQGTHAPVILGYYAEKYGLRPEQFPNAYMADRLSLALPLYVQMTKDEQTIVCENLRRALDA